MRLMCFICWWMFVNLFAYIMEWEGIWKRIFFCLYVCSYIKGAHVHVSLLFVYFLHVIMCASWWCICKYSNSNNYNKRHWRCTNNKKKKTFKRCKYPVHASNQKISSGDFSNFLKRSCNYFSCCQEVHGCMKKCGAACFIWIEWSQQKTVFLWWFRAEIFWLSIRTQRNTFYLNKNPPQKKTQRNLVSMMI